ncbi:hypothetical protein AAZX31_08G288300 [Glycine max]
MNGAPHVLSELNWIEWKIGWSNQMSQSEPLVDKVNSKGMYFYFVGRSLPLFTDCFSLSHHYMYCIPSPSMN